MTNDSLFTPGARSHLRLLLSAIRPLAGRLDRQFRASLRQRPYDGVQIRALVAVTPAAACRLRTLDQFIEQVEYNGRRLAKLNLPPSAILEALQEYDRLLSPLLVSLLP